MNLQRGGSAALAAAVPGTVLAILSVVALTMGVFGEYPMWSHTELTLAEAAGSREEAEVTRLIEQGQDPNTRYPVRAGLVLERPARLTPLEAAVLNDDPAIARQLLGRGPALDAASWVVLRCLAADSPRVAAVLDEYRALQPSRLRGGEDSLGLERASWFNMAPPVALAPLYLPMASNTAAIDDFADAFNPARSYGAQTLALDWPRITALRAAYAAAVVVALNIAYGLMRLPVQISDSLEQLVNAQHSPSVLAQFAAWSQQGAYLRPMFFAEVKALFDLAHGHYWLVFRGFHALLACAAIWLFVRALRVRTWHDFAAASFALTVFTGLHTFRGLVREAFPVSHFLQVAVLCLLALNLARSRGGWLVDIAAAVTFAVASLTLESGLLVWVIAVTAFACGMRGISSRGIMAITGMLIGYVWVRFWFLSVGTPGLDERSTGFLLGMLDPAEVQQRFGANPLLFYAYNVSTSFLSVLFSEPDGGVFEMVRAWMMGDVLPRMYFAVVSSCLSTALIGWVVVSRVRGGFASFRDEGGQLLAVSAAVVIANSAMSYVYTKHEILSVAGCFYAVAAFVAGRHALESVRQVSPGCDQDRHRGRPCVHRGALGVQKRGCPPHAAGRGVQGPQ